MNRFTPAYLAALAVLAAIPHANAAVPATRDTQIEALRQEFQKDLEAVRRQYEARIKALEAGLQKAQENAGTARAKTEEIEATVAQIQPAASTQTNANSLNPALSVILDGTYASYKNDPDAYRLPGFAQGEEAGLTREGLSIGHSEVTASANIDNLFFGQLTAAIADHDNQTEVELEEAFFETTGLSHGFTLRGGRFFSALGYLNQQHEHAWDFADAPLIYRGLFGNQYRDDGVQLRWVAPTDLLVEIGGEVFSGAKFPAGGEHSDIGSWTAFANLGGDIWISHSWQAGLSYWSANVDDRADGGGHDHGGAVLETPVFSGDSDIVGASFIYKWAPDGNPARRNFKLQLEYFTRDEDGAIRLDGSDPFESSSYRGDQDGYYVQGIYQFMPRWRAGVRYDQVDSDNRGGDRTVLDEAGLLAWGGDPKRYSAMLEWVPSEFSRIRLQYNLDKSLPDTDNQIFLQYTFSLGAHGAHPF